MPLFTSNRYHHQLPFILQRTLLISWVLVFLFTTKTFADVSPAAGEKLFKQYCKTCHDINKKIIGPPLKGVDAKHSEEWLLKWIRNNAALRAANDPEALAIWNEYNKLEMAQFLSLTDDEIKSILAYVKNPPTPPGPPPPKDGDGPKPPETSFWLIAIVITLLIVAVMLWRANTGLRKITMERAGEPVPEEIPWQKSLGSVKALFLYGFILVFILGWTFADTAMRLQRSKGYSPEQPIAFPHKLHAGINQINCLYCHSGAEKSKVAGIPSVSTCMNCHKGIQEGESAAGTAEIQKIYAAYDNNKPIQWTKIHNLPDHVYFNHSQHVAVGKIACQTCHGPVEEMEQVYQFSSLSMGWCLNCHRQTEVQFQSNDYYTMFSALHERAKADTTIHVTEAMLGGDECQKCHY